MDIHCTAVNPTSGYGCTRIRVRKQTLCREHYRRLLRPGTRSTLDAVLAVPVDLFPRAYKKALLARAEARDEAPSLFSRPSAAYLAVKAAAANLPYQPEEFSGRSY